MNPDIEYDNLVKQLLPPHKRQRTRLWLMRMFVLPLRGLFEAFRPWRDDIRMLMNITNQVKVLEGYLQKKYNALTIHIETYGDGLLLIGLEREGIAMQPEIGLIRENVVAKIPLENELRGQFGEADFIVYIPASVETELIRAEIEKYKQALTKYKIIQN